MTFLITDDSTKKKSITLTVVYVLTLLLIGAIIALLRKDIVYGTYFAAGSWAFSLIMYLMRQLTKVKASLTDKSIELDGGPDGLEK